MSNQFYILRVIAIDHPIKDATTVTLEVPEKIRDLFNYYPGQHLIIKFKINEKEVRRSYSLNSSPFNEEALQVTVKRVQGGLVSNYIGDHLKEGDEVDVMTPRGRFYADIKKYAYKTYFLFAAGSGITPIISILKSVLLASPNSAVNLFYGNRNQDTIIFKKELDDLFEEYSDRLLVVNTLSDPNVWSAWKQWNGRKGRIDSEAVNWFITNHPPIAQSTEYYICGPGAMNISVRNTLLGLQIPKKLIHIEQFVGSIEESNDSINPIDNALLSVTLNGAAHQLSIPKGKTVLQVLKEAKVNPPYSCESGVCGTCIAQVIEGKAGMKSCMALEEQEINQGLVLTCQAFPTTKTLNVKFN